MAERNIHELITTTEAEFAQLHKRMDVDRDLLVMKPFTLEDEDKRDKPEVDNITLNDAKVFATRVQSNLIRSNMQPEVDGKGLDDKYTTNVEQFFRDISLAFDDMIYARDMASLISYNIQQICQRGRLASRITLREKDGKLAPDSFLPMDTRYLVYKFDVLKNKPKWFSYATSRDPEEVRDEYGSDATAAVDTNVLVRDYWDGKKEVVFVDTRETKNVGHKYGEPPIVLQVAPVGMMYNDIDRLEHSGESIFLNNRNLYPEKNKIASLLSTLTQLAVFAGMQFETDNPKTDKPLKPPYGKKFVIPVKPGQGYKPMPVVDIKNATRTLLQMVDSSLQDGSFPRISYGTLQFPVSAVGMAELKEAEDPVYFPRMNGLAFYYQRLYRMILKQYIDMKLNVKLGDVGFEKKYPYKELDKDFRIQFKFFTTTPKQNMVNYTVASAAGDLLSNETKRRDILQLEDPEGEATKVWAERAAQLSPGIAKYRSARALANTGEEVQAQIMASEMGLSIDQVLIGKVSEEEIPEEVPPKQVMPLFSGRTGGATKAASSGGETEVVSEEEE